MTATRGLAVFLTVAVSGALRAAGPDATVPTARLKSISSHVGSRGVSLTIEASEPVGYSVTRPDPVTVVVEFRNVTMADVSNTVVAGVKSPIAAVSVEPFESMGAPASRVRVMLAQPVAHHARSERNTIVVDFDKPTEKPAPYVMPGSRQSQLASPQSGVPDATQALTQSSQVAQGAVDPIAALGIGSPPVQSTSAPSLASVPKVRAPLRHADTQATETLAQTPVLPATPAPQGLPGQARQYSGHPVSLDFQGADLRAVLRTFAEISGLNMVIDPAVNGTVDVALRDVPWDQALDIILRANKLGYSIDGTIVRISPIAVLASEEKERSDLAKAQIETGQLTTVPRQLSYAKGDEIVALLKQANILSQRGQAFVDARTNTLIVTDLADRQAAAAELITAIDRPQPQVEIEARIVQTNKNYARALGVQWGFGGKVDPTLGNTTNLAFPNSGALGGRVGPQQGPGGTTPPVPTAVNLPATAPSSAVGLALGSVNGAFNLDVALSALETTGNGRILSNPRVTTQNNIPAEMTQGVQIPIQVVSNNTVTVTFRDAALTLKVTPQITAANTVIMNVNLENASPDFTRAVNGVPPINTQRAITSVLVNDGQTTVIGGIYVSQEQAQTDRTPGLGTIPLLKWLFKRDTINDQNTELLVFITPRIIRG